MSTVSEQTVDIRNLPTKKATFYPNKAEILREIGNVKLKPGLNEITIIGVTPVADENSIKVEAHGSSVVTDMVVESIDNPDSFEDVYPLDDEDDDTDDEAPSSQPESHQDIERIKNTLRKLESDFEAHEETIKNNTQSLQILERVIGKFSPTTPGDLASTMHIYQEQRAAYYEALSRAKESKFATSQEVEKHTKRQRQLEDKHRKQHRKAKMEKKKSLEKASRAKAKAKKIKHKEIVEKALFWPKKIYKITVTIEVSVLTPGTSRRGSFESLATANTISADDSHAESTTTSLLLSYIVEGASWVPKYDLNISTVTETGVLNYRAEIRNTTSETWQDAKIVLSTSRTAFAKISEPIPVIKPWMLRLIKAGTFGATDDRSKLSLQEQQHVKSSNIQNMNTYVNRNLFGVPQQLLAKYSPSPSKAEQADHQMQLMLLEQQNQKRLLLARQEQDLASSKLQPQTMPQMPQMMQQQQQAAPPPPPGGLFGSSNARGTTFGAAPTSSIFGAAPASTAFGQPAFNGKESRALEGGNTTDALQTFDFDEFLDAGERVASEAEFEESGMTTTLELRGSRTIPPSSSARRFKIATVRLNQMSFTHIVTPKLRADAFLRARIINTSQSELLKGTAGLTLDGTFLGHTTLPRCSAGENIPLSLGIDPAISVSYPTPVSRKNLNTGMFNKELSSTFSRAVILTNTRNGGTAVNLTVRDQVPVSEDERLKIEILVPKGLQDEGDKAKAGVEFLSAQTAKIATKSGQTSVSGASTSKTTDKSSSSSKDSGQGWGSAFAKLNKFGAIEWTVSLNPGKSVRLNLEYTIRYPGTESPTEALKEGASLFRNAM